MGHGGTVEPKGRTTRTKVQLTCICAPVPPCMNRGGMQDTVQPSARDKFFMQITSSVCKPPSLVTNAAWLGAWSFRPLSASASWGRRHTRDRRYSSSAMLERSGWQPDAGAKESYGVL
jgi:hypothetical protein